MAIPILKGRIITRISKYTCLVISVIFLMFPSYAEAKRAISGRPISPTGTEVTGHQWLFVVGIDSYLNWPRLKTAVSDAKSVREVLLSCYHFDKEHLIELYDEQATRKNIIDKLRYLARIVRKDDSLVIFYAGHGHLDSITKEGSWIPIESGVEDASAWISNHDIKNYLKVDVIKAKHIQLISDSCFSGDFFRGYRGKLPEVTDKVIKKAYQLTSRQAITSGGLEPVVDEGFGKNSIFSHFLIKTLRENNKPFLIPSDFFPDIKAGVVENAEQLPRFGSLIGTGGQQGGELVFFLKQDSTLKALSAEALARKKELQRLKQLEAAAEEARKKEAEEITKHEREIAKLDAEIERMRKRLGTTAVKRGDSLDALLAIVRQKQEQERRLELLKRKREKEEAKRQAEIERLKAEREAKIAIAFEKDYQKYKEIISSSIDKEVKDSAWNILISEYPDAGKRIAELKRGERIRIVEEERAEAERIAELKRAERARKAELRRALMVKKRVFTVQYFQPEEQPESVLGFGFYSLPARSHGWYVNLQLTMGKSTEGDLPSYEEDQVTNRFNQLNILNAGITYQFVNSFGWYIGIGYAESSGVAEVKKYYGSVYYDDGDNDESGMNLDAGILINIKHFTMNIGYGSFAPSVYLGIGFNF